jgi:hypothetical protein
MARRFPALVSAPVLRTATHLKNPREPEEPEEPEEPPEPRRTSEPVNLGTPFYDTPCFSTSSIASTKVSISPSVV